MRTLFALLLVSFLAVGTVTAIDYSAQTPQKTVPKRPPIDDDGPGDGGIPPFQLP